MKTMGLLIVLSGPSGVGKGTVCDRLLAKYSDLEYSISMTTRPPRKGEVNGTDYYFVSKSNFLDMISQDEFLEWAVVFGNYYGTPKHFVDKKLRQGKNVVLEIDIQGALQVKQKRPDGVFIFLLPPSLDELKKRIMKRGTEKTEDLQQRLTAARKEIETVYQYHYAVINNNISETADLIYSIVEAEKCRVSRLGEKNIEEVIKYE